MTPVIRIAAIVGREPEDIAPDVHAQSQNRPVHIIEVTGHLVDLQDFAIGEPGGILFVEVCVKIIITKSGHLKPTPFQAKKACCMIPRATIKISSASQRP